eukprot:Gb_31093 [translate_table: standard]
MANERQPMVEDVSLRDNIDLYLELQSEIIWLQGEIEKITDGDPYKLALMAMLESLEKMVKDFKEAGHEEDVWERIQLDHPTVEEIALIVGPLMAIDHAFHDIATRENGYHTNYVDSIYEMEHGQASLLDAIVDDECREYVTSTSMPTDVQVTACPDMDPVVSQTNDSMTSPLGVEAIEYPNTAPVVSQTHDFATSPLGEEVMTCPDTTPMASVLESVLGLQTHDPTTSPLGLEAVGIDIHRVIGRRSRQIDEDLEDGNRSQQLRREIDTEDIVPPRDSISS